MIPAGGFGIFLYFSLTFLLRIFRTSLLYCKSNNKDDMMIVLESCPNFLEYSSKTPKYFPYDNRLAYFDDFRCVV